MTLETIITTHGIALDATLERRIRNRLEKDGRAAEIQIRPAAG